MIHDRALNSAKASRLAYRRLRVFRGKVALRGGYDSCIAFYDTTFVVTQIVLLFAVN
jgi:hypothetical protein